MFNNDFLAQIHQTVKEAVAEQLQHEPMTVKSNEEFLTLNQAASLAQCHKNTIRNRIKTGELEQHKSGRLVLVKKADVLKMLGQIINVNPID